MTDKFLTQIDKFVVDTETKMLNVIRHSINAVVDDAQKTVEQGGKMRVDTGFLRNSGLSQIGSMPSGASKGDPKGKYMWTDNQLGINLNQMKAGDTFYFGWTANYAKYREVYDGFLDSAAQNWQAHVDEAVRRLKK